MGFFCTGIHPLNPGIFTEIDFLPSLLTDLPETSYNHERGHNSSVSSAMEAETATASRMPTCTKANIDSPSTSNCHVSILKELSPIPDASSRRRTDRKRKSQRSKILTSGPYKAAVAEKAQQKVIAGTRGRKCKRTLSMVQSKVSREKRTTLVENQQLKLKRPYALFVQKHFMKTGYSAARVKAGHTKNVLG
jgi:hypothetical protein